MLDKTFWKNVVYSHLVFSRHENEKMAMPELLFPLCSVLGKNPYPHPFLLQGFAWSKSILALGRMSAASPLLSFAGCAVVHPSSVLCPCYQSFCFQDGKSVFVAADIFLYQKPWKNKGLIHMQKPPALKNEEINRTRHPSELPAELFPPVPTVFYMMLLNVFKEAIETTISEIPFIS